MTYEREKDSEYLMAEITQHVVDFAYSFCFAKAIKSKEKIIGIKTTDITIKVPTIIFESAQEAFINFLTNHEEMKTLCLICINLHKKLHKLENKDEEFFYPEIKKEVDSILVFKQFIEYFLAKNLFSVMHEKIVKQNEFNDHLNMIGALMTQLNKIKNI